MSDLSKNQDIKNLLLFFPERTIEFLYRDYYNSLLRVAERRTHDVDVAEYIVQEAFADIWENRQRIAHDENVFAIAHLYTIVNNKAVNLMGHYHGITRLAEPANYMVIMFHGKLIKEKYFGVVEKPGMLLEIFEHHDNQLPNWWKKSF